MKKTPMKKTLIYVAIIGVALASLPWFTLVAQDADAEQRMEEVRIRLGLSEAQAEALAPVLQESMAAQQRILSKYGINLDSGTSSMNKLRRQDAMAMKGELDAVRNDTLGAVGEILNQAQFEEFKRIQAERAASMRQRIRAGR